MKSKIRSFRFRAQLAPTAAVLALPLALGGNALLTGCQSLAKECKPPPGKPENQD